MFNYICLFCSKSTDIKEHLISLYCNDDDQLFQPGIQEILGSIAFEVCPNPCFLIVTLKPVIIKFQVVKENRYNYVTQYFTLYSNIPFKWQLLEVFLNVINCKLSTNNLYSLFVLLQALERGCVCEERVLSGRGAKKYGSMLSRLFERSWEKNHLSDSNSLDIINFTLSWKPFVQFLDMFCKRLMIWETCHFLQGLFGNY